MATVNKELSRELKATKSLNTKSGDCYYNSFTNIQTLKSKYPGILYAEGYVISDGIPIEHAWLQIKNQIIELTWAESSSDSKYYSFVQYNPKQLTRMFTKIENRYQKYPLSYHYGNLYFRMKYFVKFIWLKLFVSYRNN